jgi:hypothetical protein
MKKEFVRWAGVEEVTGGTSWNVFLRSDDGETSAV